MKAANLNGGSVKPRHNGRIHADECRCPTCNSIVSPELYATILGKQRAHDAEIERAAEIRFASREAAIRKEAAATAAAAMAPKLAKAKESWKALERQMNALKASTEATIAQRLEAQHATFDKAISDAVLAERAKYVTEKLALESQLEDLKRRVQARTANQLGEPAEVDLYEALATAFPDDRVARVAKGVRGADVLVEVIDHDEVVGKIVLDSKNHARWSNKFTSKLRTDQLAEGADFAILSTSVFPAGAQHLHIQDNVVVASPQRVVVLVHLLRRQIIQNYVLKLSFEARTEKADRLYDFIISPTCGDLLDRIVTLTADMVELDRTETTAHKKTWEKRAGLIRAVQDIHGEFSQAVSAIIAGNPA